MWVYNIPLLNTETTHDAVLQMCFNPYTEQTGMMFFCAIYPHKLQSYVISHTKLVFFNITFFLLNLLQAFGVLKHWSFMNTKKGAIKMRKKKKKN